MALTSSLSNASAFSSLSKMPTKSSTKPCGLTISSRSFSYGRFTRAIACSSVWSRIGLSRYIA